MPVLLLCIVIALMGSFGCGSGGRNPAPSAAGHDWFQITFGAEDTAPADWSGSVKTAAGRVTGVLPLRFDKDDKVAAGGSSWICHTRYAAMLDPKYWYIGALHTVPKDFKVPQGPLVPNGVFVGLERPSEVLVQTAQGEFRFVPAEVRFGAPIKRMNGRVTVERVPQPLNLTGGDGMEDDTPTVAVDSREKAWVAWIGYRALQERLYVARPDGSERRAIAEGEFFRPALAAATDDRAFLAASIHSDSTWKIGVAARASSQWGDLNLISEGGPDISPRAAVDSVGNLWVVWQAFRDGRSRILARAFDGKKWGEPVAVSNNARDAWEPAVAVDSRGAVHFAWDAYDDGVFNIYYRAWSGGKLQPQRRVMASAAYQAHASVACDPTGAVWLAWAESGPNWGKDTGFLVRENRGTMLYESRSVRIVKLAESGLQSPAPLPKGHFEQPQIAFDSTGTLWCMARRRETKLHEVWSPSLKRNRMQQYSLWDYAVMSLAGKTWSQPIALPHSAGRNDARAAMAIDPKDVVLAVWAGDGRSYARPYPFVKNEVYAGAMAGSAAAAPVLTPVGQNKETARPVHPEEAKRVARIRAERIPAGSTELRILRGDMHRHTDISFDGDIDGSMWDFYRYTIDAADFDYSAMTDHNAGDDIEYFWWIVQKSNDLFYYPGRFTPLYSYERSLSYPNGHRNLIWSKRGVRTLPRSPGEENGTEGAARLYEYLRETGGLAMSHTSATLMGTDWRDNDPALEPLVEIFQGDRTSAEYEGAPRAPKGNDPFTQPGGYKSDGFVWNAWAKGLKLGVQASSDHASTHVSYAVLLAENVTRDAILKAIAARHAYAATDNILLDVRSGAHIQGDIFTSRERPRLSVRILGTAPVDKVEIIKNNKFVFTSKPGQAAVKLNYEDRDAQPGESYYYVRVQQRDGQMAWSSPMWIRFQVQP